MNTLTVGNDPNLLKILVRTIEIKPYATMRGGCVETANELKMTGYNLKDVLYCILEDYTQEQLVNTLNGLLADTDKEYQLKQD